MSEHPILFSGPMVNAILADLKTMTRRVMRGVNGECSRDLDFRGFPANGLDRLWFDNESGEAMFQCQSAVDDTTDFRVRCPYGKPGDTLWVRECFAYGGGINGKPIVYRADWPDRKRPCDSGVPYGGGFPDEKWRPSIHMPRWASRITLKVITMRAERVQEISPADCLAEGIAEPRRLVPRKPTGPHDRDTHALVPDNPIPAFRELWDSINAKPRPRLAGGKIVRYESYPWDNTRETRTYRGLPWEIIGNPLVWVPEFEVEA